jgi:hypothetical protein
MRFKVANDHVAQPPSAVRARSTAGGGCATWLIALTLVLATIGCRPLHNAQALKPELAKNDEDTQMEFWHSLTDAPVTSNDQAFHGLLLYLHEKDDAADYPGRVQLLKNEKLLSGGFDEPADAPASRGTIAVALVRAMHIKGGLNLHLLPMSERYATRELQFLNIYPPSTSNQTFSGNEFVGIIGRVEDYQRGDPTDVTVTAPTGEMPSTK